MAGDGNHYPALSLWHIARLSEMGMMRRRWRSSAVDSDTLAFSCSRGPCTSSNLGLVWLLGASCFRIPHRERGYTTDHDEKCCDNVTSVIWARQVPAWVMCDFRELHHFSALEFYHLISFQFLFKWHRFKDIFYICWLHCSNNKRRSLAYTTDILFLAHLPYRCSLVLEPRQKGQPLPGTFSFHGRSQKEETELNTRVHSKLPIGCDVSHLLTFHWPKQVIWQASCLGSENKSHGRSHIYNRIGQRK